MYIVNGISSEGYDILNGVGGYGYSIVHDILGGQITNKHFSRCWWTDLHADFDNSAITKIELLYNSNGTWTRFDVWEGPLNHDRFDQRNVTEPNAIFTPSEWNRDQESSLAVGTLGTYTSEFDASIFIAPNPVVNDFKIQNLNKKTTYKILNTQGSVVQTGEVSMNKSIQTHNLNSGFYILKLKSNQYFKFLKK
jgi:hypothetical protein